jgi:rod shape-determining protein MreC
MVVGKEGDPPLRMDFVSNLADVKVGDVVVTSGADGIYPRGFRIGSVEHSERGDGLSLAITVRPSVDFRALDEVLVVLREARAAIPEGTSEPGGPAR